MPRGGAINRKNTRCGKIEQVRMFNLINILPLIVLYNEDLFYGVTEFPF